MDKSVSLDTVAPLTVTRGAARFPPTGGGQQTQNPGAGAGRRNGDGLPSPPENRFPEQERQHLRLRLAAQLLRGAGRRINLPHGEFSTGMTAILASMDPNEHQTLMSLVDWVIEFDPDPPKAKGA